MMYSDETEATQEQKETYEKCYNDGLFKCPDCGEEWIGGPEIENKGEAKTQIYCPYCSQFLFIEDYQ